jgi:hypothetical protein
MKYRVIMLKITPPPLGGWGSIRGCHKGEKYKKGNKKRETPVRKSQKE